MAGRRAFDPGGYLPALLQIAGQVSMLSAHALGIAFDINASSNPFGRSVPPADVPGSVLRLVPIFERHGFVWGGRSPKPDPMHFEYADRSKLLPTK